MKRLLGIVTIVMIVMTVLMPLIECFDRWDRPGPGNDTELPLFLITLFIAFVVFVAAAIARRLMDRQNAQTETKITYEFVRCEFLSSADISIPLFTFTSPPLRI